MTTYTSQGAFLNALQNPAYFEGFNAFSGQTVPNPQSFSLGPVGFTLDQSSFFSLGSGIFYSNGSGPQVSVYPTTSTSIDSFIITFSGNVTAVGGNFFLTDGNLDPVANGNLVARLSTGEILTLASSATYGAEPFGGFISTTPIDYLVLTGPNIGTDGEFNFPTLDNLYISGTAAAVPEPGAWTLALAGGGAMLGLAWRRRMKPMPASA